MRAVELFAGAGGAALGLHAAGIQSLARCEWDRDACATLRAAIEAGHLDPSAILEGDVRAVDWSPYVGADLLAGSPPCQAWSTAGLRLAAQDTRNGWPWAFAAIDAVRPRWTVLENVPGMTHHKGDAHEGDPNRERSAPDTCPACYFHGVVLPELRRRFPVVQWAILDSADYGVPQRRHRLFVVGGPVAIAFPSPTHSEAALSWAKWRTGEYWRRHGIEPVGKPEADEARGLFAPSLLPWRTVRDVLDLTTERVIGGGTRWHGMEEWRPADVTDTPSATINAMTGSTAGHYMLDPKHPPCLPDEPATTLRSGGSGHDAPPMWLASGRAATEPKYPELLDEPAPTVAAGEGGKGCGQWGGGGAVRRKWEQSGRRRLTVEECATLQDFPDGYPFHGTQTSRYKQVGNACVRTVMEALYRAVLRADGGDGGCGVTLFFVCHQPEDARLPDGSREYRCQTEFPGTVRAIFAGLDGREITAEEIQS